MKIFKPGLFFLLLLLSGYFSFSQKIEKSLLWQISGNGLEKPSYLYGTIHMLCNDDAVLSDSLLWAIENTDRVYLELDLDNIFELFGAIQKMKMRNDTTLKDLLTPREYQLVKEYIESRNSLLPFSILETYKPMLASSTLLETGLPCSMPVAVDQVIMQEAKKRRKKIDGLETMAYQLSIFDSIPYKIQAEQLLKLAISDGEESEGEKEFTEMMEAYKNQDLEKLDAIIKKGEEGLGNYENLLLYNRNKNWVDKLKKIMAEKPVTVAVGAGHLPGEKGLIELLRKEGYTVKPVKNNIKSARVI